MDNFQCLNYVIGGQLLFLTQMVLKLVMQCKKQTIEQWKLNTSLTVLFFVSKGAGNQLTATGVPECWSQPVYGLPEQLENKFYRWTFHFQLSTYHRLCQLRPIAPNDCGLSRWTLRTLRRWRRPIEFAGWTHSTALHLLSLWSLTCICPFLGSRKSTYTFQTVKWSEPARSNPQTQPLVTA